MTTTGKLNHAEEGATPPPNTKRVYAWKDIHSDGKPAKYTVTSQGQDPRIITVSRRKRQVLEGLMNSPIHAASYCRISDQVLPLRRDHGINITCTIYKGDRETGREIYGVYTLDDIVRRIDGGAA